ncbi:MAG TPA: GNAT family N-acetyltransferase [Saprospiraceae bacterium]|nr:GNAT family N-acetyltransferase [Saprospiraceae bacterium]MCB9328173.1 GNAT family N-acetyltransferase [Lewinellaceae bacterium]HPK09325.1 GNAT family N-acetyltransferase [Saprospiraceae bacterium]HRX29380.1 GNAT family N-acetyltransferase [Saprospiraceae bacterium]
MILTYSKITTDEYLDFKKLVDKIWPSYFSSILSPDQIDYMMNMMYSQESFVADIANSCQYYFIELNHEKIGYLAYQLNFEPHTCKLHKFYLLEMVRGKGIGRKTISWVESQCKKSKNTGLILNVNRFNETVEIYRSLGFTVIKEIDVEIGRGYLMEDYIMELKF